MSDALDTVWSAEPHTIKKHEILSRYLKAWMAILTHQAALVPKGSRSILYVDGFAGPGIYTKGQPGSPIVAMKTAIEHTGKLPVPVRFLFIEAHKLRYESLKKQVAALQPQMRDHTHVAAAEARHGDCTDVLGDLVARPDQLGGKFGPAMVFLDQFGYSQIPIELIGKIMKWESCEVLSYLEFKRLNHTLSDPDKAAGITRAFGSDRWKNAIPMTGHSRQHFLLDLYKQALRTAGNARYVLDFGMYGEHDTLLYWLFFSTNHLRGLEEMKKAMWAVDSSGSFRFTDHDSPGQLTLMTEIKDKQIADSIAKHFAGRKVTVAEIKEFVLVDTAAYKYKEALKILECERRCLQPVEPPSSRRAGQYPDEKLALQFGQSRPKERQAHMFE